MNGQPHLYTRQVPAAALAESLAPFQGQLRYLYRETEARLELLAYTPPEPAGLHGRAFGPSLEIRWEWRGDVYELLLMSESEPALPDGWQAVATGEAWSAEAGELLLWGTHLNHLSQAHYLAGSAGEAWIETRIPRAMQYPVEGSPRTVRANIITYYRQGQPQLTRLVSLEGRD